MRKNAITLIDSWIVRYPEAVRGAILEGFYLMGAWPDEAAKEWRMVRVEYELPHQKKQIKFGVVPVELLPHIKAGEILCLTSCDVRRIRCFHLTVSAVPANGNYTLGFIEEKNAIRIPLEGTNLTRIAAY